MIQALRGFSLFFNCQTWDISIDALLCQYFLKIKSVQDNKPVRHKRKDVYCRLLTKAVMRRMASPIWMSLTAYERRTKPLAPNGVPGSLTVE